MEIIYTCKNCGVSQKEPFKFCPDCGAPSNTDETKQNPISQEAQQPDDNITKREEEFEKFNQNLYNELLEKSEPYLKNISEEFRLIIHKIFYNYSFHRYNRRFITETEENFAMLFTLLTKPKFVDSYGRHRVQIMVIDDEGTRLRIIIFHFNRDDGSSNHADDKEIKIYYFGSDCIIGEKSVGLVNF